MKEQLEITKTNRKILGGFLNTFSLDQLNKIPEGFSNNIIWNIAHTIVTQQLLMYKLSGLPLMVDNKMVDLYKKGTKPENDVTEKEVEIIKGLLFSTLDKTAEDIDAKVFKNYQEYPTSTGFILKSVSDAITFNNYHEGIHLGYVLALKKSL
ncbi:hypothetical protein AB832_06385 [Flavobacteriaceae bacterium (ex Bugula neritina AB1)]|nr:hypothetical protein AB832_06385 [Flavobacteriaceae bacterium (ex Bugula neritina AB1)]